MSRNSNHLPVTPEDTQVRTPLKETRGPRYAGFRAIASGLLLAIGVAVALRCPMLDRRPMHNDEAVNAIKFGRLWEEGMYKYDPNEHHGPTLYYGTMALALITRAPHFINFSEDRLRSLTVLFGLGMILILPLVTDGLGRKGTIWAAIIMAVSPAFVFYSRYYIHEMLLVFFTFLALGSGWRYWKTRRLIWALLAGAGLGLMHATKETFVITIAAAGLALAVNQVWNRLLDASKPPKQTAPLNGWHLAAALGMWFLVAVALFSSFFTNAGGLMDSIRTYGPWLNRAGGESEHIHRWNFYVERLLWFHSAKGPVWTEALILVLAMAGGWTCFLRRNLGRANASFGRFLALYTVFLAGAYTIIAYKTPWCLLSFWLGAILLAGLGAAVLIRSARRFDLRIVLRIFILGGLAHLAWQAVQLSNSFAADQRNPYVYAQTSPDVLNLSRQLYNLADVYPDGKKMLVKVMAPESDYWPLPWYLRRFSNVGWYEGIPKEPFAPVMIVSAKFRVGLDEKKTHLMIGYFALRPQVLFEMYVQKEVWQTYLVKNPPRPQSK